MSKKKKNVNKEFRLSSWAIDNRNTIYLMIGIILVAGLSAYNSMPRENFPEIKETKIYVSTPYPGNTAEDIERLIIDPLEDRLKNVSNVVEVLSTSQEDYGIITVEFDELEHFFGICNFTFTRPKDRIHSYLIVSRSKIIICMFKILF